MFMLFAGRKAVRPKKAKQGVRKPRAAAPRAGLAAIASFGSNPGALRMNVYAPPKLRAGRPLVVVLHGCGQHAVSFATGAGWVALANGLDFALLMPEQTSSNNPGRCFNWFRPGDVRRDAGETKSIRQMIRAAVKMFGSQPSQIFIAGFSAGGGMAAAMLASYPALFNAGAVVAGMPVGSASTPMGALLRMRKADASRSRQSLARDALLATNTPPRKRWPRISIWQGEEDRTVDPANAEALAAQWGELHGSSLEAATDEMASGARQRTWGRPAKPPAVELWTVPKLAHGFPVDRSARGPGSPVPWVLEAGISAADHIASFWNLKPGASPVRPAP